VSQPSDKGAPFDPLGFWRSAQDATLDTWSKSMIELVNSQPYAEATARMMDTYLSMSIPMRKMLTQTMEQALGEFNMPTRAEVVSIAERMTNIEMRLDDLDARLDDFARQLDGVARAVASLAALAEAQRQATLAPAKSAASAPAAKPAATKPAATKPAATKPSASKAPSTTSTSAKTRKAQ
jgi:hypothetical protein